MCLQHVIIYELDLCTILLAQCITQFLTKKEEITFILLLSTGTKCIIAKLCFLYKIVNNLTSFPANIIRLRYPVPFHIRSCHALLLSVPHVRTGYCYFSFVHRSCKLWNILPLIVLQSCTSTAFKHKLKNIL